MAIRAPDGANKLNIMNSVHSIKVVSSAVPPPTLMVFLAGHLFKRVGDFVLA